jgi:hypothetical protein
MTNGAHHGNAGGSTPKSKDTRGTPTTVAKPHPKSTRRDAGRK